MLLLSCVTSGFEEKRAFGMGGKTGELGWVSS